MKKIIISLSGLICAALGAVSLNCYADAADIRANLSKLRVPDGFKVDIYAEVPGARQMALGSNGNIYVGTRGNKVYAVVDRNKDRKADQVVPILDDLNIGNGVAMYKGNLYVAEQNRIARYAAPDFDLTLPFKQMREVIYDKLPDKFHHGWRYIAFGPDNKLYVTVGAPCNICDPAGTEASIIRMNPDGSEVETFAKGVRNSVGIDFQPATQVAYFTDNGVDMMGDDVPPDELNTAKKVGQHFGFPHYAGGSARHEDWIDKALTEEVVRPTAEFQAHSGTLGFKFYSGKQFPNEYLGNAIIAQHGSWNRSKPVGYQLVRVKFDEQHRATGTEVFIDGWLNNGEIWGRPTDVLQLPDGSILVSDDYCGVIYRVSYGEEKDVVTPGSKGLVTGLKMPESSIAHPDGRVFVTEIGGFGEFGDGKITIINSDGSKTILADKLDDPKGIDLFNNELYVADINRVIRIDLKGNKTVIAKSSNFPRAPIFLNDIEIDGNGNVFVSDSGDGNGKGAAVYMISRDGKVTQLIGRSSGIKRPNGLLLDGASALLVTDFREGKLYRLTYAIIGGKVKANLSLLNQGFGGADGLIRDPRGMLYVSDWAGGKVWQLSDPKATPQLISEGHQSSADLNLSPDGKFILMPDMKAGTLVPISIH